MARPPIRIIPADHPAAGEEPALRAGWQPPAGAIPVTADMQIELTARAYPAAGGVTFDIYQVDQHGQPLYSRHTITAPVPIVGDTTLIRLRPGWLIAVGATASGAVPSWSIGHARAALLQPGLSGQSALLLFDGLLQWDQAITWPWSPVDQELVQPQIIESSAAAPAVGQPALYADTTGVELTPIAIEINLTTSAVVGNRQAVLQLVSAGVLVAQVARCTIDQPASTVRKYIFSPYTSAQNANGSTINVPIANPQIVAKSFWDWQITAVGLDAGDQFGPLTMRAAAKFSRRWL